jgi:hypothetical protein
MKIQQRLTGEQLITALVEYLGRNHDSFMRNPEALMEIFRVYVLPQYEGKDQPLVKNPKIR